jgi:3-deoxy-D-manno-octulosonate 8-phosphate phosphatase (KDO 8-P phosphatase)
MIKLIILDIDGVLTDGTKTYNNDGNVISKKFNDRDFTAIKRFKASGINVCFLSGDRHVNERIAQNRKIDFFYARQNNGIIDKSKFIEIFSSKYSIGPSEMLYVGDDIFDLKIIEKLSMSYCPSNSPNCVKKSVSKVLNTKSGEGVIMELYDLLTITEQIPMARLQDVEDLDMREKYD